MFELTDVDFSFTLIKIFIGMGTNLQKFNASHAKK